MVGGWVGEMRKTSAPSRAVGVTRQTTVRACRSAFPSLWERRHGSNLASGSGKAQGSFRLVSRSQPSPRGEGVRQRHAPHVAPRACPPRIRLHPQDHHPFACPSNQVEPAPSSRRRRHPLKRAQTRTAPSALAMHGPRSSGRPTPRSAHACSSATTARIDATAARRSARRAARRAARAAAEAAAVRAP